MLPTSVINMPQNPSSPVSPLGKILRFLLVFLRIVVAASLGAVVVVFLAFAVGKVLVQLLPFTIFEATLLALLGLVVFATVVVKIIEIVFKYPAILTPPEDDSEDEAPETSPTAKGTVFEVQSVRSPAPIGTAPRRSRRPFLKPR